MLKNVKWMCVMCIERNVENVIINSVHGSQINVDFIDELEGPGVMLQLTRWKPGILYALFIHIFQLAF